jgi:hypothetical protein
MISSFVKIENPIPKGKLGSEIPDGTIFTGCIGDYLDKLFLKFGDQILTLDRDGKGAVSFPGVWSDGATVKNYAVVKSINVTI